MMPMMLSPQMSQSSLMALSRSTSFAAVWAAAMRLLMAVVGLVCFISDSFWCGLGCGIGGKTTENPLSGSKGKKRAVWMFLRGRTDFWIGMRGGVQTLVEGTGGCKGEKFKYSHIFVLNIRNRNVK